MITWLRIEGDRIIQIYRNASAFEVLDPKELAIEALLSGVQLRGSVEGESPSVTVEVAANRAARSALEDPPLGNAATLFGSENDDVIEVFVGVVQRVELNNGRFQIEVAA